jgi:hypothetical protein
VYIRSTPTLFQANSKFSQIEQSPANAEQNPAKKKAWFSLDFLVGNEPFQGVALTPGAKKSRNGTLLDLSTSWGLKRK